eukprot:Ihof_evm9s73 gene=Ihof_evmTU9s73
MVKIKNEHLEVFGKEVEDPSDQQMKRICSESFSPAPILQAEEEDVGRGRLLSAGSSSNCVPQVTLQQDVLEAPAPNNKPDKSLRRDPTLQEATADNANLSETCAVDEEGNPKERLCYSNNSERNATFNYCDNHISTSRYTVWTFLPVNIFEQFQRVANVYFLIMVILTLIPQVSSLNPATTAFPLVIVLAISAIKDGADDWARHKSDRQLNSFETEVLRDGEWVVTQWQHVVVGDFVRLERDDAMPADLLVLSSSLPHGICYVDTADLDGENNLKIRSALKGKEDSLTNEEALSEFKAMLRYEVPSPDLYQFSGKIVDIQTGDIQAIDNSCILLRGMKLRNTEWCVGLVLFTGNDTKLMMNNTGSPFKRTKIDQQVNWLIIYIFAIMAIIAIISAIMASVWARETGFGFAAYLPLNPELATPAKIGVVSFFSFVILYSALLPISLYVSIEFIRLGQSFLIYWDLRMYHEPTNTPAVARTTTLNEELGQIEYVFSDKTGTLTQNVMRFMQCSIGGRVYGKVEEENRSSRDKKKASPMVPVDFSFNSRADPNFVFYDQSLVDEVKAGNPETAAFFHLLSLCHTVQCEEKDDGKLVYNAESPDEAALVEAAKNFGYVFRRRDKSTMVIEVHGEEEKYEILQVLEFNSDRKRMSMILRYPDNTIHVLCKGADSVMFPLLTIDKDTTEVINNHLELFATIGLRTLVVSEKVLNVAEYEAWNLKHTEATLELEDRGVKVDAVSALIENNLTLVGVSAIEDRLQVGVPLTIASLHSANIKIWVLTGDKQETAVNIGFSCKLLTNDMQIYIVNGRSSEQVASQLHSIWDQLGHGSKMEHALIIDGTALTYGLEEDLQLDLLRVAEVCTSVICCRVSPLQKAMVVQLVRDHRQAITLAIGDGANDVSMIQSAHIGVGISGLEGRQAVMASDFSIGQFRYLERLLLVHGRWSYLRMCRFLSYFFYKNFCCTLCQLWFAIYSGWSAQTVYDAWFLSFYNIVFTSLPVMAAGIFEQDVNDRTCILYPTLYQAGQRDLLFNRFIFFMSLFKGAFHSAVCFFVPYAATGMLVLPSGAAGYEWMGVLVSGCVVVVVNLQMAMDMLRWTVINYVCILGSICSWWVFSWFQYAMPGYVAHEGYYGVMFNSQGTVTWWATLALCSCIALMPVYALK